MQLALSWSRSLTSTDLFLPINPPNSLTSVLTTAASIMKQVNANSAFLCLLGETGVTQSLSFCLKNIVLGQMQIEI